MGRSQIRTINLEKDFHFSLKYISRPALLVVEPLDFGAKVVQVLGRVCNLVDEQFIVSAGEQLGVVIRRRPTAAA